MFFEKSRAYSALKKAALIIFDHYVAIVEPALFMVLPQNLAVDFLLQLGIWRLSARQNSLMN